MWNITILGLIEFMALHGLCQGTLLTSQLLPLVLLSLQDWILGEQSATIHSDNLRSLISVRQFTYQFRS